MEVTFNNPYYGFYILMELRKWVGFISK